MNKKILSGVLAAVSMLSVSAPAFASTSSTPATQSYANDGKGVTYNVTAGVSYGTVDVTVPTTLKNVIINPYGAAIKTTTSGGDTIASKSAIASEVYEIKNNDATDGIKVMATVSVTKAAQLVVIDDAATMPTGWDTATVSKTDTTVTNDGQTWNKLISYDKITTVKGKDGAADTYTGGAKSAKQAKNVVIRLIGNKTASKAVAKYVKNTTTGVYERDTATPSGIDASSKTVGFLPKGSVTGELGSCATGESVFFSVDGEMNPELPADTVWDTKDSLSLSIVLKVLPVVS